MISKLVFTGKSEKTAKQQLAGGKDNKNYYTNK